MKVILKFLTKNHMNNQILQTCLIQKVKNLLHKEEINKGKGLKILIPNQILSRLSIPLAQSKAGNNSERLKNEIRQ